MHDRWEATRGLIPPGNLIEVRYEDLVADVVGRMREIYQRLGLGDFEQVRPAIEGYLADRADYRPGRYDPPPELKREIYRRWRPYYERHGYEAEGICE